MIKTKYNAVYIILLLSALSIMFVINSGTFRSQNIISDWDNDLEGWKEEDPKDFAKIDAVNSRMRIEYNWRDMNNGEDWFIVKKVFTRNHNWALYDGIAFFIVGDGDRSDTKFRVMINDDDECWVTGNTEQELQPLNFIGGKWIIINFNDFKHDAFSTTGDNYLNLNTIREIGFNFWDFSMQKGVVYFDELQLIHLQWWRQNLPIIFGVVSIDVIVAVLFIVYIFNIKGARRKFQDILKIFKRS